MSSALFRRLCSIRQSKVERAEREALQCQATLALREAALRDAQAEHGREVARKHAMAANWRERRLALAAFDTDALNGHQVELLHGDRCIAHALAAVEQCAAERDEAALALEAAQQALARRRVELNKAEQGVSRHLAVERVRAEAMEEDELDELAVLAWATPAMRELRA
jgi:hypothetical protein